MVGSLNTSWSLQLCPTRKKILQAGPGTAASLDMRKAGDSGFCFPLSCSKVYVWKGNSKGIYDMEDNNATVRLKRVFLSMV